MRFVDALGTRHFRAPADARVVSLVPSITELLFALGLAPRIVGRTGFCIHPRPAVDRVPKVGGTKDVDLAKLRALAPTHVIVNIDENEAPTVDAMRDFVPNIIVTHPNAPEDNFDLYRLLGGIFASEERASELERALLAEISACRQREWPIERVLYLIWKDPWMTVASDTYIARTLALVGWRVATPAGGATGAARYPKIDDLAAALDTVDRVLLSTEPFMFRASHLRELQLRYAEKPFALIDGEMTSWYGPRAIRGLAYLRDFRATG